MLQVIDLTSLVNSTHLQKQKITIYSDFILYKKLSHTRFFCTIIRIVHIHYMPAKEFLNRY